MTETSVVAYETASLTARREYAATLASAGQLIPKGLFDPATGKPSPGKILLVMETGSMLGLHPMAALQSINVVEGRATLAAQLMAAKIRQAGHRLEIRKTGSIPTGDYAVTVIGTRVDTGDVYEETWDIPRGMRAGLVDSYDQNAKGVWEVRARSEKNKPKPWEAYAEAMPKWRAISDVAREGFSDVTLGLYSYEEMTDGGFPLAEPDPEPTEDWPALFAAAQTREELNAIGERLAEKGEGTDKLRIAFQARAGVLAREANTEDADVVEDDEPTEMCMVCKVTGPAGFECPHPDAHTPLPTSVQDANGEPTSSAPRNDPPPAWRGNVASASTVAGVRALRHRAEGAGWLTDDVAEALDARESALAEVEYEAAASAEFDAAVDTGEV